MQNIVFGHKAMSSIKIQHQQFYQLESVGMRLANTKFNDLDANCIVYTDAANQVIQRLIQREGCLIKIEDHQYRYFIEELGDFPCLIINDRERKYSSHHRRITVLFTLGNNADTVLQLRNIIAINPQSCLGAQHTITPGISSWRYFTSSSELNQQRLK